MAYTPRAKLRVASCFPGAMFSLRYACVIRPLPLSPINCVLTECRPPPSRNIRSMHVTCVGRKRERKKKYYAFPARTYVRIHAARDCEPVTWPFYSRCFASKDLPRSCSSHDCISFATTLLFLFSCTIFEQGGDDCYNNRR